jgi:hypothetical protein
MKALIQSHFPQRSSNLPIIATDLVKNGLKPEDIIFLLDYGQSITTDCKVMLTNEPMPINWWHGVASVLDTDYVVLLCDDLTLKENSLNSLKFYADKHPEIDVFGFEGGQFAKGKHPYTNSKSHISTELETADYVIRFYFARPRAFAKALDLYTQNPTKPIHDDLLLSLANRCAIVPTTYDTGWDELSEYGAAYSNRKTHYQERDRLIYETNKRS